MHKRRISELSISNFLFRIELGKKYFHRRELDEKLKQIGNLGNDENFLKEVEILRQKAYGEESDHENLEKQSQGLPVTYG